MRVLLILLMFPYISFGIMVNPDSSFVKPNIQKSKNITVKNILIKKITKNKIYSQNGKVYKIKRNTKIIKNYKNKPIVAELHFKDKKLIEVILK